MTVVVDANVVFEAVTSSNGFRPFGSDEAVAPPLLWPEVRSALHVARTRDLMTGQVAATALAALQSGPLRERRHRRLGEEAWRIADDLGWSKTYDAEYLALAFLLGAPIASLDRRLLRAAELLSIETHTFR